ncbi:hypothetical protein G2W53_018022 [Senna tora]|uniref:Uncharacterized protein n=1 Tax=Senna tora TaxID=362788 RepID=A0A834TQJ8_9FABA|nr:hypothetical protein G2W53_018022 [Senna tora]
MLWLPHFGIFNCFTVVSNDWLLHPAVAKLLAFAGFQSLNETQDIGVPRLEGMNLHESRWKFENSRQLRHKKELRVGVPITDINRARGKQDSPVKSVRWLYSRSQCLVPWILKSEVSIPHQSQRHDSLFLGFKILGISMPCQSPGISMPCQSLGLEAWFLGFKISEISMPYQSPSLDAWHLDALPIPRSRCLVPWIQNFRGLDALPIPRGLDAWFLGFKFLGISMLCQSPGFDAWFLGFKFSGISMPCQSPGLDAWFLGFKISGVLMPCQSPGLDAWFLGFKISGVLMPCQSPGLDAWGLDAVPIPRISMPGSLDLKFQGSRCPANPQGSRCPANPQVSMHCSLDLRFHGSRCPANP